MGQLRPADHHAVVGQEHHVGTAHGAGDALALGRVQRQAVVVRVHRQPAVEAHRRLRQRGVQRTVGGQRQRGGMRHVGVQHAGLAGDAVDGGMDEHRRRFHRVAAGQRRALGVDQHDVVGLHLVPQQAARVQQEAARLVGQFDAEVVAHAFGQAVVRGGAQRQGQVGAQRGHGGAVVVMGMLVQGHGRVRRCSRSMKR
jgi:hypothetical protein